MNRFIFGRGWVYEDEADDGTQGGAGGAGKAAEGETGDAGEAAVDDADAVVDDAGAAKGVGAGAGKDGQPKDMLEAITKGLEKTAPKVDDPAAKKAEEEAAAAAVAKADKHANGAPKKDAAGNELDDKGAITKKAEAPKAKTAAELDLTADEKKALNAKTGARFNEVISTLKSRETEIATLTEQMKPLAEARDTMIGILEETKTSSDQLSAYLEFNRMLQSGDPKELESALQMIENQRATIYQALGREPAGGDIDLLKGFHDLKKQVEDEEITRAAALEIAAARREKVASAARTQQQQNQQHGVAQVEKARKTALADITAWTKKLTAEDLDYKAKEDMLLEQVDEVLKTYPPNQWLTTLQMLYRGIVIQKAPPVQDKTKQPLRPSGPKTGAKAPQNMFEAMWGAEAPK